MIFTRKHELKCEEVIDRYLASSRQKLGKIMEQMDYEVLPIMVMMISSISAGKARKKRVADIKRDQTWWRNGYRSWTDKEFKKNLRVSRNIFQFLLETVRPSLTKRTTNAKPNLTTVDRQLASTLQTTQTHS